MHGKFLHKGKPLDPAAYALDPENQRRLWEISEQLTDARDIAERGAAYNPSGSVGMYNDENTPEGVIRPHDNQPKLGP